MKKKLFLTLGCLLLACVTVSNATMMIPKQANQYVRIYKPTGDHFFGPDTENLKAGKWYDEWVPNDHCFIKAEDGKWHIFGITHPLVWTNPLVDGIHEGEFASFHARSTAKSFKGALKEEHYEDHSKILPPKDRPGEIPENHAPYIVKKEGLYHMVYGYSPIRMAVSKNLFDWEPVGFIFSEMNGARDPNLLYHEGLYYIVYCSMNTVCMRTSEDLKKWSKPTTIFVAESFHPESPSLIFNHGTFYLFLCAWNGIWDQKEIVGAYQHKTYVMQSDNPTDFGVDHEKKVTTLNAHAPEIFQDEEGQWYISSVEWPKRGISVDKMDWVMK